MLIAAHKSVPIVKSAQETQLEELDAHFMKLEQARRKYVLEPMPERARALFEKQQIAEAVMRETRIERETLARQLLNVSTASQVAVPVSCDRPDSAKKTVVANEASQRRDSDPLISVFELSHPEPDDPNGFSDPLLLASVSRSYAREWIPFKGDPQQRYLTESIRRGHQNHASDLNAMLVEAEDKHDVKRLLKDSSSPSKSPSPRVDEVENAPAIVPPQEDTKALDECSKPEELMDSILSAHTATAPTPPRKAAMANKSPQKGKTPQTKKHDAHSQHKGKNVLIRDDSLTGVGLPRLANIEPHGGVTLNVRRLVKPIGEDSVRLDYTYDGRADVKLFRMEDVEELFEEIMHSVQDGHLNLTESESAKLHPFIPNEMAPNFSHQDTMLSLSSSNITEFEITARHIQMMPRDVKSRQINVPARLYGNARQIAMAMTPSSRGDAKYNFGGYIPRRTVRFKKSSLSIAGYRQFLSGLRLDFINELIVTSDEMDTGSAVYARPEDADEDLAAENFVHEDNDKLMVPYEEGMWHTEVLDLLPLPRVQTAPSKPAIVTDALKSHHRRRTTSKESKSNITSAEEIDQFECAEQMTERLLHVASRLEMPPEDQLQLIISVTRIPDHMRENILAAWETCTWHILARERALGNCLRFEFQYGQPGRFWMEPTFRRDVEQEDRDILHGILDRTTAKVSESLDALDASYAEAKALMLAPITIKPAPRQIPKPPPSTPEGPAGLGEQVSVNEVVPPPTKMPPLPAPPLVSYHGRGYRQKMHNDFSELIHGMSTTAS